MVRFLIIRLDSIKFAPHDQAVEDDQDLKGRTNKNYHANCTVDQNKNQNYSTGKVQNLGNERR